MKKNREIWHSMERQDNTVQYGKTIVQQYIYFLAVAVR